MLVRESFIAAPFARLAGCAVQSDDPLRMSYGLAATANWVGLARFIFALIYLLPLN